MNPEDIQATGVDEKPSAAANDPVSLLKPMAHPEIVFGLVGPIGVELQPVIDVIQEELVGKYTSTVVRLSSLIEDFLTLTFQAKLNIFAFES